jgi:hypothetical protein
MTWKQQELNYECTSKEGKEFLKQIAVWRSSDTSMFFLSDSIHK